VLRRALRAVVFAPYLAVFYPFLMLRRARAAIRPGHGWRTWITPELLLGGFIAPGDVGELRALGIGAVVNVSSELYDPELALRAAGIAYHRVPCWDMRAPKLEDARRGVEVMAEHIRAGRAVYVHCASGVGRSVSVLLCYLATYGGLDVDTALAEVTSRRPRVAMSVDQRKFVDAFVSAYRADAARA
jgi:protein-tyrosine phosphatase